LNKNKTRIFMMVSACLILVCVVFFSLRNRELEQEILSELTLTFEGEEYTVDFCLWQDEADGCCYLFLPSWFREQGGEFILHYSDNMTRIEIDGKEYKSGMSWSDDGTEKVHSLAVYGIMGCEPVHTSLQALCSENLPAVFITVEEKDEIFNMEESSDKKYFETGFMRMFGEGGELLCESVLEKFKVRGNLTATFDKKPFTFTMKEAAGLLGMEPAVKWNLLANATDGTYIRNKIIRDLAYECIDAYEPQGEFTEVYLNGEFQGLYLLTEAVEIGENRLEIDPEQNWFVEMELDFRTRDDETEMITERGQHFIIHADKPVTALDKAQILERLNDVESALFAEDGISAVSGRPLRELIDLESFAEAWLVEELSGDHDIGIASQFAYALKEEGSLWYAGPVWDFDGIMGNVNKPMYAVPEALTSTIEMSGTADDANQNRWLSAMWRHSEFQELVKSKYIEIFRDEYERILTEEIDKYVETIRRSAVLDAFRWHDDRLEWFFVIPEGVSEKWGVPYAEYDTLDICLAQVTDFMTRKLDFLDKLWIENREFCVVEVRNSAPFLDQGYNQTLYYWVERGTAIRNLPCYENEEYEFEGYFDKDYGELISDGFIIEYNRIVEGHWKEKGGE